MRLWPHSTETVSKNSKHKKLYITWDVSADLLAWIWQIERQLVCEEDDFKKIVKNQTTEQFWHNYFWLIRKLLAVQSVLYFELEIESPGMSEVIYVQVLQ